MISKKAVLFRPQKRHREIHIEWYKGIQVNTSQVSNRPTLETQTRDEQSGHFPLTTLERIVVDRPRPVTQLAAHQLKVPLARIRGFSRHRKDVPTKNLYWKRSPLCSGFVTEDTNSELVLYQYTRRTFGIRMPELRKNAHSVKMQTTTALNTLI